MNRDSADRTQGRRRRRTSEIVKLELQKQLKIEKLGLQARENVTEKGGHKKQLNRVKLGLVGEEKLTEGGGHRHGAKKQLNSICIHTLL